MQLRPYRPEDAQTIVTWVANETVLYQWSSDRLGKFPPTAEELNLYYQSYAPEANLRLFCAEDEEGKLQGHFFLRRPFPEDSAILRIGFIILDPALRGKGLGTKMLQLALDYAKNELDAKKITMGVYTNNPKARACYAGLGFAPTGERKSYRFPIGEWECEEMELFFRSSFA